MKREQALAVCRALPGATEDIKWQDQLVFSVGGKMFALASLQAQAQSMSFKVEQARFLELSDRPGIVPAPYLARAHWVQVQDLRRLPAAEGEALLRRAWELVFAKLTLKAQAAILAGV
ncbi:MmcQ/YjbR family DNA-binding protein [Massilia sp. TS11]|uniref:MmcQ/YjbR family DNA-binding protein n=1 Tax=Massilia sp. TS11 TaxID=2908003 RepID=UPI001EDB8E1C|nr:MmcQ/YjbR family DNA-binding protein [Massilia sp. TS11]MCG2585274.1 MmcQ/YjbR family DNA-binding protein [Massilia sp. TS11]